MLKTIVSFLLVCALLLCVVACAKTPPPEDIVQEVAKLIGNDVIYGFHWLGAIYLTDSA